MDTHTSSTENNDKNLTSENGEPNNKEQWVFEDTFEDIFLIIDLSCTEHVEDLEEHKEIEYERQMSRWCSGFKMSIHILATNTLY
jgi:hypothetical protein